MSFGSASSERDLAVQRLLAFQQTSNDSHVYECLSSSPECDSNLELRHGSGGGFRAACKRKSDSSAMGGESKVHHQPLFVRSVSLPYCGSETESELYAPYSFYTGDEVRHRSSCSYILFRLNVSNRNTRKFRAPRRIRIGKIRTTSQGWAA